MDRNLNDLSKRGTEKAEDYNSQINSMMEKIEKKSIKSAQVPPLNLSSGVKKTFLKNDQ